MPLLTRMTRHMYSTVERTSILLFLSTPRFTWFVNVGHRVLPKYGVRVVVRVTSKPSAVGSVYFHGGPLHFVRLDDE